MIRFLLSYSDLISALFGLGSAIAFGWPAIRAVRAKRYWERHRRLSNDPGASPETLAALERGRARIEALQLAGSREAMLSNSVGVVLLGFAFLFLLAAAIDRRLEEAAKRPSCEVGPAGVADGRAPVAAGGAAPSAPIAGKR